MADLKSTGDASEAFWSRNAANFGYHAQEPWYGDVWNDAGGGTVDGFFFIVIEDELPHLSAFYEMPPEAVAEGRCCNGQSYGNL